MPNSSVMGVEMTDMAGALPGSVITIIWSRVGAFHSRVAPSHIYSPRPGVSRALRVTLNTIVVGTCLGGLAACPRSRPTCMLKPDSITLIDSAFLLGDAGASISLSQTPTDRLLCL